MEKRIYQVPHIEHVELDNAISLALQSDTEPPFGPFETSNTLQDSIQSDKDLIFTT